MSSTTARSSSFSRPASGVRSNRENPSATYNRNNMTDDEDSSNTRGVSGHLCGIPNTTLIATIIAGSFYTIVLIMLLSMNCPWDRDVGYFFSIHIVALLAIIFMAAVNMTYTRYRFNCLSLTCSLIYSGSAGLILFGLIYVSIEGLCNPDRQETTTNLTTRADFEINTKKGMWASKDTGSISAWLISSIGLIFQVVAHYYYG